MSSKPDWSKAPEGATHYQPHQGAYYKHSHLHRCWLIWASDHPMGELRWHQAHGTDEKQLIARPAAWSGTGLPPVGTVCEVEDEDGNWHECRILAHHMEDAVFIPDPGYPYGAYDGLPAGRFRPLRAPEQIAIGDRVKKVTGDYQITGEVRSVFTKANGETRLVVEHNAEGGGSFLHIYGPNNLEKIA